MNNLNSSVNKLAVASLQTGVSTGHKKLDVFVGTWKTKGEIKVSGTSKSIPVEGIDIYKWLPGGYFLAHQVNVKIALNVGKSKLKRRISYEKTQGTIRKIICKLTLRGRVNDGK